MKVLLVNPPVYDFALYDFWLKPYGLLRIASALRNQGMDFDFFDFLNRGHKFYENLKLKTDTYGRGKFYSEEVKKPEVLSFMRRKFKRYGIPLSVFLEEIKGNSYDYVLIATGMTYWYIGVKEIIEVTERLLPEAKIVVGGVAATLMPVFYQKLGADIVVRGDDWDVLTGSGLEIDPSNELPLYDVYTKLNYAVIRITEGCPLRCLYCASSILKPGFRVSDVEQVADLVEQLYNKRAIRDFVFYDDALLYGIDEGLLKFFKELEERKLVGKVRFHTPNALHVRKIDEDTARFLKKMGFETIYLGVETINPLLLKQVGEKLSFSDLEVALMNLKMAGFEGSQITAYILLGLPGQDFEEVEESIRVLSKYGINVSLSEFSPIPGTPVGDQAINSLNLKDPLLTNNSVFPTLLYGFERVNYLKNLKINLSRT